MKQRFCLSAILVGLLLLSPTLAGAVEVKATFADGKGTSGSSVSNVVDAYRGMDGGGWDAGWLQLRSGTSAQWDHVVLGPGDTNYTQLVDENYLRYKVTANGKTPNAAIGRDYTGLFGIDPTKDHTLQFTMRIEEDLTNARFLGNDIARYQIHDRVYTPGQTTNMSYSSAASTWGIQLRGDDPLGVGYNGYWSILGSDLTGIGPTSTGLVVVQNAIYAFTLAFHPTAGTFDVDIVSDLYGSYSGTGFGLAPTATGGNGPTGWLDFWTYQTKTDSPTRQFALDDIKITGTQNTALPGGMNLVAARFTGGNATDVVDGYTGMAGDGWDGAWKASAWRTTDVKTVVSPGDEGFNEIKSGSGSYLKITTTGNNPDPPPAGHGKGGVGRDYRRDVADPGINWTEEHTIKFTVRIDEDIAGGAFNTALDRYQIYDSSAPVSNIDNTSAWAIEAFGASDGGLVTEEMVGQWIFTYGDGTGANAGHVDSNIDLVMGGVYDFTIVVDPENRTYDAKIQYGETSFTANDLMWKGASATVGGSLTFMSIIDLAGDVRAWSIDDIVVSQGMTLVPGDADNDGQVDADDAKAMADNWGKSGNAAWADGDFNGDLKVDAKDAAILAANWGYVAGSAAESNGAAVPEPGMAALLVTLLAGVAMGFGRRRFVA